MSTQPSPIGQQVADLISRVTLDEHETQRLEAELEAERAARTELGTTVDKTRSLVTSLTGQVNQIEQQLADASDDEESKDREIPYWDDLDQHAAAVEWRKLLDWVEQVLATLYEVDTEQLPPCWPRHAAIRAELSWLRAAYLQAMEFDKGAAVGEWHTRWLPGALDRIRGHLIRRGCLREERSGRRSGAAEYEYAGHKEPLPTLSMQSTWDADAWREDIDARPQKPRDDAEGVDE